MNDLRFFTIAPTESSGYFLLERLGKVLEQQWMVARFGSQNEMHIIFLQLPDVWAIGAYAILNDNYRQPWIVRSELGQEPLAGIALAIIFGRTVLSDYHLWC